MGCHVPSPTHRQLKLLYKLVDQLSSEMLTTMCKSWRDGEIFDFWLQDAYQTQMLIDLFELDAASE